MHRRALVACSVPLVLVAAALVGTAASLDDPVPRPAPTQTAIVHIVARRERIVVTGTAAPTGTPTKTPTGLEDCNFWTVQNTLCVWPTSSQIIPIPVCGTPDPGQACVRRGPTMATMGGLATPTPSTATAQAEGE